MFVCEITYFANISLKYGPKDWLFQNSNGSARSGPDPNRHSLTNFKSPSTYACCIEKVSKSL